RCERDALEHPHSVIESGSFDCPAGDLELRVDGGTRTGSSDQDLEDGQEAGAESEGAVIHLGLVRGGGWVGPPCKSTIQACCKVTLLRRFPVKDGSFLEAAKASSGHVLRHDWNR